MRKYALEMGEHAAQMAMLDGESCIDGLQINSLA